MDFFIEYKWLFMVIIEVLFWVLAVAFGLTRYLLGRERLSQIILVLLVVNYSLLVPLAVLDYMQTREIATFQIATIVFIIYVLIYGKRHFLQLDASLKRKVAAWKGEVPRQSADGTK